MKKLLLFIGIIACGTAFADNAKTTTSQGYVDTQIATKQDKVPAVDTNTVITTTDTTGEIGEKAIYDASGNYAEQADALVTAADANAAVQNAIDTEFVCIEWAPNTAETPENCYIWKIRNTVNPSKNLFNIGNVPSNANSLINNGDGTLSIKGTATNSGVSTRRKLSQLAPGLEVGKTYTLSFNTTSYLKYIALVIGYSGNWIKWSDKAALTVTQQMLDTVLYFEAPTSGEVATISNVQIEEGPVATPYQPYGENTYLPQGN